MRVGCGLGGVCVLGGFGMLLCLGGFGGFEVCVLVFLVCGVLGFVSVLSFGVGGFGFGFVLVRLLLFGGLFGFSFGWCGFWFWCGALFGVVVVLFRVWVGGF